MAITGHNWSCFLNFSGGRGVGAYIGAFLAISPKILGFSLLPLALISLTWNAAVATLLFSAAAILFSFYLGQWETAGIFTTFSLLPILIKRLSPLKEIFKAQKPFILLRNRLLFDNNEPV